MQVFGGEKTKASICIWLTSSDGLPMRVGKVTFGVSSPENPALHRDDPASMTTAACSSESAMLWEDI